MSKEIKRIAVLGGGNGGFTVAGHMALKGFGVTLWEHPDFAAGIAEIMKTMIIHVTGEGVSGDGKLEKATTDLAEAVSGVDLVVVTMPAFAQKRVAEMMAGVWLNSSAGMADTTSSGRYRSRTRSRSAYPPSRSRPFQPVRSET